MPTIPKTFADGQLPAAKGTLYTTPALTYALVTVVLVATGGAPVTVNLYLKRSGSSSRRIIGKNLSMDPGDCAYVDHEGRPFALSPGDLIEGDASSATEVDYTIDGIEQT
jgi:hypothetical protein